VSPKPENATPMTATLKRNWPEYLIEATALGLFMVSATLFTILLEHPASPLRQALPDDLTRRLLMGLAMGGTAIAIIYSPWGRRSGAHMNPSVTLTFLRLGKIAPADAFFYMAAQFAGGLLAVLLVASVARMALADPAVRYAATVPGPGGPWIAFAAEVAISFVLMLTVLGVSNSARLARFTGLAAGGLVAAWITFEAPLSGMSMNPARSVASAVPAGALGPLWIYFTAPPLGMLLAAESYRALRGTRAVACAKLHHDASFRCIFRCGA
jgi:aquaporin Z